MERATEDIDILKPLVDKSHKYGIGFRTGESSAYFLKSYETIEELERAYIGFFYIFEQVNYGIPIPFEINGNEGKTIIGIIEKHNSLIWN